MIKIPRQTGLPDIAVIAVLATSLRFSPVTPKSPFRRIANPHDLDRRANLAAPDLAAMVLDRQPAPRFFDENQRVPCRRFRRRLDRAVFGQRVDRLAAPGRNPFYLFRPDQRAGLVVIAPTGDHGTSPPGGGTNSPFS